MGEREALLAAVVADPDNDLPRLVYADWLDDHGDPDRAEFIRVQIELTGLSSSNPGRRTTLLSRTDLLSRAGELYARERLRWVGELPTPKGVRWVHLDGTDNGFPAFDRGFASHLRVNGDPVLTGTSPALFAATPVRVLIVQRVRSARSLHRLIPPRSLRRVKVVVLPQQVADALDSCPLLDQVDEIVLPLSELPTQSRRRLRSLFGKRLRQPEIIEGL